MQLHRVRLRHAAAKRALRKLRSQGREVKAASAQQQAGLEDLQAAQQQARLQLDSSRKQREELQACHCTTVPSDPSKEGNAHLLETMNAQGY